MKILHIINSLATGGAEKLILETLPLYAAQGIVVDLLLLNGTKYPFLKELEDKKCCRIFSLGNSSVYHPKHIMKIMPYLKNYDLVHVHLFPAQYYVAIAKMLSFTNTKLIFTEHSTSNRRFENKIFKPIDKIIYNQYHKIIAITHKVARQVINHAALRKDKITVIENGISLDKINTTSSAKKSELRSDLHESDYIILQVSSFQEPKDQSTVIKSLVHLPDHFKVLLVGEGVQKEKCVNLATELRIQDRVFFLGVRMDVPQLLKTADIVVLSSKYEGLSLSSIEGMASGKPFIASNVPGLSEIVKGAGVLFPLGDAKKLAEEILLLATDQKHYDFITKQCLSRAEHYDISIMVQKHLDLYRELTKK